MSAFLKEMIIRCRGDKERFNALYGACFNADGSVKSCGREACVALIRYLGQGSGDEDTGIMNVKTIHAVNAGVNGCNDVSGLVNGEEAV